MDIGESEIREKKVEHREGRGRNQRREGRATHIRRDTCRRRRRRINDRAEAREEKHGEKERWGRLMASGTQSRDKEAE